MSVDTINVRRVGSHENGNLELFSRAAIRENTRGGHEYTAVDTDPEAPKRDVIANVFFRTNGAGKAQAYVRFPSGAIQILATEP